MDLNNFYEDYAFNPDDFELVEGMYRKVVQAIIDYIYPLQDNRIARHIEDYRIVPIQYIDISEASYTLSSLLTSEQLKSWDSMEMEEKVQILKESGRYIQLTADRKLFNSDPVNDIIEEPIDESANQIIDFELWETDEKGYQLVSGIDYYYRDNQLFFFGKFASPNLERTMLKMTNIAIDFNTVDDILGENLNLTYLPEKTPKIEFNDFVRVLTLAASRGFVLKDVESGINELPSIQSDIEIFDKNVSDPEKAAMWENGELELGPFDFVVYFPAELDYYRVSLICEFLDKTRYLSSHYHSISYDNQIEEYSLNVTGDDLWDDITYIEDDPYGEFSDTNFYLNGSSRTNRADSRWGYAAVIGANTVNRLPIDDEVTDELDNNLGNDAASGYDDSESADREAYRPTDKQLFLGKRVMENIETEEEGDFNEIDPSLLNDANSRLAYASDEDKENLTE